MNHMAGADKKGGSKTATGDKEHENEEGGGEGSNLTQKQRRRAQVRKAQMLVSTSPMTPPSDMKVLSEKGILKLV